MTKARKAPPAKRPGAKRTIDIITPRAPRVATKDKAQPCGCGGHNHDAQPAPAHKRKTRDMSTKPVKVRASMLDRLRRSFHSKDEAGFEEAMTAVEEATEEEQAAAEQAALMSTISEAVSTAIAPVVQRLDAVESFTADFKKTRDDEAAAAAAKAEAEKAEAEKTKDRGLKRRSKDDGEDKTDYSTYKGGGTYDPDANYSQGGAGAGTNDNEALAAFLKAKGLSDEDIAEACMLLDAEKPTTDGPDDTAVSGGGDVGGVRAQVQQENAAGGGGSSAPGGESTMVGDSATFMAEFRDTIARAEILDPGIKLPTFDAKAASKKTFDAMCALRRAALSKALASADRKKHVAAFVTDAAAIGKMSCEAVKMAFIGASESAKRANVAPRTTFDAIAPATTSINGMSDRNKALWG